MRGPGVRAGYRRAGRRVAGGPGSDASRAHGHAGDGRGRAVADPGTCGRHPACAAALRRVVRAAPRLRMGRPAGGAGRAVEVHRRPAGRAVRHLARSRGVGQPDRRESRARGPPGRRRQAAQPCRAGRFPGHGAGGRRAASEPGVSQRLRTSRECDNPAGSQGSDYGGVAPGHGHLGRGARRRADCHPRGRAPRRPAQSAGAPPTGLCGDRARAMCAGRAAPAGRARCRHAVGRCRPGVGRLFRAGRQPDGRPRGAAGGAPSRARQPGGCRQPGDPGTRPGARGAGHRRTAHRPGRRARAAGGAVRAGPRAGPVGRPRGAAAEANTLLGQLPPGAPQRAEVRRLLDALR